MADSPTEAAAEALALLDAATTLILTPSPMTESVIVEPLRDIAWTHTMESAMYTEMVTQHCDAKRAGAGFKIEAWMVILASIQDAITIGHRVIKAQCQGKTIAYKKKWAAWQYLLGVSGWGWDPQTKMFSAANNQWTMQIAVCKIML